VFLRWDPLFERKLNVWEGVQWDSYEYIDIVDRKIREAYVK
jgi:hypothetical protein